VSVPAAELSNSRVAAPRKLRASIGIRSLTGGRFYVTLAVVALVIAALTLLIPSTPSYDPWAWIVWGREIIHLDLHTTGGPTWKPLPVIFTTLFAPFGKAAPDMWLVVGRAGAIAAVVMVFKVAARLVLWLGEDRTTGETRLERAAALVPALFAGTICVIALVLSGAFIKDNALGYSEGLMTALVLIGVERHLDGHYRQAFTIGFLAALDRPELWVFWGPYGLWLWWKDPGARKLVYALFALIPVLWFGPELWGSGHLLRGATRALHARSNSPAFTKCPFCTEFHNAWVTVLSRMKFVAAAGVLAGGFLTFRTLRRRGGLSVRKLLAGDKVPLETKAERARAAIVAAGLFGVGWWILVAILTQAGFSGNNRYLVLGAALIEIAGAATWGWAAIELGKAARRFAPRDVSLAGAIAVAALAWLFVPGFVGNSLVDIPKTHGALNYQASLRSDLNKIVADYGGAKKLLACGTVMTEGFQVPMVAWTLGVRTLTVQDQPTAYVNPQGVDTGHPDPHQFPPNVILQTRNNRSAALLPLPSDIIYWEQHGTNYQPPTGRPAGAFRVFTHCK
jgi:hypothetical protein